MTEYLDHFPQYFAACRCRAWRLVGPPLMHGVGRCGNCGVVPKQIIGAAEGYGKEGEETWTNEQAQRQFHLWAARGELTSGA